MNTLPKCPKCSSKYAYKDDLILICSECAYEWTNDSEEKSDNVLIIKDANGNTLQNGDTITVIKDLKIKGSSLVVKVGTKIKNIKLAEGEGDHDIDCKIEGIGPMHLKSKFVKKI
jgi:protein PhnA